MELTSSIIQLYSKYTTPKLKIKAQTVFNAWIRKRDAGKRCVSCSGRVEQAGHFYSAGQYNHMRFLEDNCHGQCVQCNYYKHGNLIPYRIELEKRIGSERLAMLDMLSAQKKAHKTDRFYLIEIIEKYK